MLSNRTWFKACSRTFAHERLPAALVRCNRVHERRGRELRSAGRRHLEAQSSIHKRHPGQVTVNETHGSLHSMHALES
jgi:hypothetical protein